MSLKEVADAFRQPSVLVECTGYQVVKQEKVTELGF